MLKIFPIDFLRQILEQTLYIEHLKNEDYFGGDNQMRIISFYEQLKNENEVDRFVETYRQLTDQLNRNDLIGAGIVLSPENPTLTNIHSSLIAPFTYTCSIKCQLSVKDQMIITLNNLIEALKGRKRDMFQLKTKDNMGHDTYKPFMVGTLLTISNGVLTPIKSGDYIGEKPSLTLIDTYVKSVITGLEATLGSGIDVIAPQWVYYSETVIEGGLLKKLLKVAYKDSNGDYDTIVDDGSYDDVVFPPEHTYFEQYKVSLSFESLRIDEPRTLNADDICEISFGGSATLVSNGVLLGNDLNGLSIVRYKVCGNPDTDYAKQEPTYLEPLEMTSGNSANTITRNLASNNFLTNTHTGAISPNIQYSFIVNTNVNLINKWFLYARYGTTISNNMISPNMIYLIREIYCSFGSYNIYDYKAKVVENIDIENTESDVLSLSINFQIQGDNN